MELGAEHCALEVFRTVVPVSDKDELLRRGLEECQNTGQDLGVGGPLNRLIGLEVDRHDENGSQRALR